MPRVTTRMTITMRERPLMPAGFRVTKCPRCKSKGHILTAVKAWCPRCCTGYVRR